MSIIGRIANSLNINFDNQQINQPKVSLAESKPFNLRNIDERFHSLSAGLEKTPVAETSAVNTSQQTKSIQSSIKVSDQVSAAQLETDLKAILRPAEQKNIKIQNGKLVIIDANAVNPKTASKSYQYLLQAATSGKTFNYKAIQPNNAAQASNGDVLTWDQIRGGAAYPTDANTIKTAKVIDIFVPVNGAPDVFKKSAAKISSNNSQSYDELTPFPREIVTAHELFGHGLCGEGRCAIMVENEVRKELKLPERSGVDHDILPTEKGEKRASASEKVEVTADFSDIEKIEATPPKISTEVVLRKPEPLPLVILPPK